MQSYLLRPDYFEQVNGMLEENSTAVRSPSMRKTMTVPRLSDGVQLLRAYRLHLLVLVPRNIINYCAIPWKESGW
jgi:hypothetical protein